MSPSLRRRAGLAVAALLLAVSALTGCNLQTIGAPKGPMTLTATFDDAQGLVVGNSVQINNVVIGSVAHIDLHGYRARVRMQVSDKHKIPADATATIRQSTLLGEYFVDIGFPAGEQATKYLRNGDTIEHTDTSPPVEAVVGKAGQLLDAVSANDLAGMIQAGAVSLKDRGPELHHIIEQFASLTDTISAQSGNLGTTIDDLGQLGRSMAPLHDQLGTLLDNLSNTTTLMASERDRFFTTLDNFNKLLVSTNANIIQPHAQQLSDLIVEANTILASLNNSRQLIQTFLDNFANAVPRLTKAVRKGQLLFALWTDLRYPNGGPLPPFLQQLYPFGTAPP